MNVYADREVSIIDAARMIYRTRSPSDGQIHRVYELMKHGVLRPCADVGSPLKWTTTEVSLAEFLAAHRVEHAKSRREHQHNAAGEAMLTDEPPPLRRTKDPEETKLLLGVYHGIWRDYFRAVLLRKRIHNRSRTFDRAVVLGQVVVLASIVTLAALSIQWTIVPTPPEQQAIVQWMRANTDDHSITQWYPAEPAPDGAGVVVRVAYRYTKDSRRWVHSDRTFRVQDGLATELAESD